MNMNVICRLFACDKHYTVHPHTIYVLRANGNKKQRTLKQTKLQCSFLWAECDSKVHTESVNRSITYCMLLENLGPMPTSYCIQRNWFQRNSTVSMMLKSSTRYQLHSCLLSNVHAKCAKHIKINDSSRFTHQWCGVLKRWKHMYYFFEVDTLFNSNSTTASGAQFRLRMTLLQIIHNSHGYVYHSKI